MWPPDEDDGDPELAADVLLVRRAAPAPLPDDAGGGFRASKMSDVLT